MSEEYDFVEKSSPWTRPGVIAAAGFLALILVLGIVLTAIGVFDDDKTNGDATPGPTSSASSTPTNPAASICGLPGHETSGALGTAPRSTTWELVGSVAVPSSRTSGPGKVEDSGLRYCYAHTKEGAVFAAANFYSWGEASRTDAAGVIEHGVASGPGFEAALEQAKNAAPAASDSPSTPVQIRGFRLISYSDSTALVDVAFEISGSGFSHHQLELAWDRGDWRVRVLPDGSLPSGSGLPDLTGYVPWAGA
jgi:hypothetical protein